MRHYCIQYSLFCVFAIRLSVSIVDAQKHTLAHAHTSTSPIWFYSSNLVLSYFILFFHPFHTLNSNDRNVFVMQPHTVRAGAKLQPTFMLNVSIEELFGFVDSLMCARVRSLTNRIYTCLPNFVMRFVWKSMIWNFQHSLHTEFVHYLYDYLRVVILFLLF